MPGTTSRSCHGHHRVNRRADSRTAVGLLGVTAAIVSLLVVDKPVDAIKWALSGFQDGTV